MKKLKINSKAGIENRYGKLYEVPSNCYVKATFKLLNNQKILYIAFCGWTDHFNFVIGDGEYFEPVGSSCLSRLQDIRFKNVRRPHELILRKENSFIDWYKGILQNMKEQA